MKTIQVKPIYDIFSRKERKTNPKNNSEQAPKILVDYREKNSLVPAELISLGLEIEFRELKVADFLVRNVAIERKTVSDFISSMINKRLLRQLEELQQYEKKILIIEGIDEQELYNNEENKPMRFHRRPRVCTSIASKPCLSAGSSSEIAVPQFEEVQKLQNANFERPRNSQFPRKPAGSLLHPNSIRGFLLTILLRHNIPVLFTKDYKDTARFLNLIARKKEQEMSIRAIKRSRNKKEQLQYILEGFPGIGPKTARKLLEEFGSIKSIVNSDREKLKSVLGKKSDIFMELIDENYKHP